MQELRVTSLGVDKTSGTPVVILKEKGGERLLPIWIGPGEASAIAMEMAGIHLARPLTHDLFSAVVRALGGELVRVLITKVIDNTYFASLVFHRDGEYVSIDSRPSDGVALALRAEAPIYADETLLEMSSIEVEEASFDGEGMPDSLVDDALAEAKTMEEPLRDYLKNLRPEDFGRFEP